MKLTREGLHDKKAWENAGITLPAYDAAAVAEATKEAPSWVHFGAGNIFRIFIGGVADQLIAQGDSAKGIVCAETFDFDVIDKIYKPYDNLVLAVTLKADGSTEKQVLGSLTEAVKASASEAPDWDRLNQIFTLPQLQMISFTITEKGYALKGSDGAYFPFIQKDIDQGPAYASSAMAVVCALLYQRYQSGRLPLAVVSMDNCSHNGEKLGSAIQTMAQEWKNKGFVEEGFLSYLNDESLVSFPWSMIDKITPRPADSVCSSLTEAGVEDIAPIITSKNTYIAPFVNAEGPQYLVIEDKFPNGRPALEKAGVYMTDRETVNKVERMKVTTCLNPLHTALAVYGCVLGYTLIADEMKDEQLNRLVHQIGPVEGMPVVTDPGILSPEEFVDEVINVRIPNPFMPDTPQRIATDTSQKVGIRYGETIKAYMEKFGDARKLTAIPLAIAGWCRYLLAVDDKGQAFELSSDPMNPELTAKLAGIEFGKPDTYQGQLRPILSNANIFGVDLYQAGIGELVEQMFCEQIAGPGAVRETLKKYLR
ncbi:MAG: mannitol dehydrogenase family protein [Lachnospiraceae bacterium]